jgi:hypothetical protein
VVIHRNVDVVVPQTAALHGLAAAVDAPAAACRDFSELLYVDMQEFPGGVALLAVFGATPGADAFAADRVQFPEPGQPGPGDDPGDRAGRDLAAFSQLHRAFAVLHAGGRNGPPFRCRGPVHGSA